MSKLSIGAAVTPVLEKGKKQECKELTVLKENSKESIYCMVFEHPQEIVSNTDQAG